MVTVSPIGPEGYAHELCTQMETILKVETSGDERITVLMEVEVLVNMRTYEHAST